jgi:hypothetical protein
VHWVGVEELSDLPHMLLSIAMASILVGLPSRPLTEDIRCRTSDECISGPLVAKVDSSPVELMSLWSRFSNRESREDSESEGSRGDDEH